GAHRPPLLHARDERVELRFVSLPIALDEEVEYAIACAAACRAPGFDGSRVPVPRLQHAPRPERLDALVVPVHAAAAAVDLNARAGGGAQRHHAGVDVTERSRRGIDEIQINNRSEEHT